MAMAMELMEPPVAADPAVEPESREALLRTQCQEREAAEFIVRQVLERGATFRDE